MGICRGRKQGIRGGEEGKKGFNIKKKDALNLTSRELGSGEPRGSRVVLICMPEARASEGSDDRNRRAARDSSENGLKRVRTSVMNRGIMAFFLSRVEAREHWHWRGGGLCVFVMMMMRLRLLRLL